MNFTRKLTCVALSIVGVLESFEEIHSARIVSIKFYRVLQKAANKEFSIRQCFS